MANTVNADKRAALQDELLVLTPAEEFDDPEYASRRIAEIERELSEMDAQANA